MQNNTKKIYAIISEINSANITAYTSRVSTSMPYNGTVLYGLRAMTMSPMYVCKQSKQNFQLTSTKQTIFSFYQ